MMMMIDDNNDNNDNDDDSNNEKCYLKEKNFIWETFYLKTRKVATFLRPRKLCLKMLILE